MVKEILMDWHYVTIKNDKRKCVYMDLEKFVKHIKLKTN